MQDKIKEYLHFLSLGEAEEESFIQRLKSVGFLIQEIVIDYCYSSGVRFKIQLTLLVNRYFVRKMNRTLCSVSILNYWVIISSQITQYAIIIMKHGEHIGSPLQFIFQKHVVTDISVCFSSLNARRYKSGSS